MTPQDIKALRLSMGLSMERFARKLDVGFATVSRWEKGGSVPNALGLAALRNQAFGQQAKEKTHE